MPEPLSTDRSLEAPLPDHIRLAHDGADLVLDVRWFRPYHVFMLVFTAFWCGFLVFWYTMAFKHPPQSSMILWFPLIHVGVGLGIAYSTLAGFMNHTWIRVGSGAVDVKLGPLPWTGA